jgi:hypothetical protein
MVLEGCCSNSESSKLVFCQKSGHTLYFVFQHQHFSKENGKDFLQILVFKAANKISGWFK